jgi:hypothetical protein
MTTDIIASTEYTRIVPGSTPPRLETTTRTYDVRTAAEAKRVAEPHQRAGRRVTFSCNFYRDPATGQRGRFIRVLVRARPRWEQEAERMGGFGL